MNDLRALILVGATAAPMLLAGAASADSQEAPAWRPMQLSAYDLNGDGSVTRDEFDAAREKHRAARAAEGRPMRMAADAPSFSDLDTDGDGKLTEAELTAGREQMLEQSCGMGMGPGMGHGMGTGGGMGPGPEKGMGQGMGAGMHEGMGAGHHYGHPMPRFEDIDRDGDGFITDEELTGFHNERMNEHAGEGHMMKHHGSAPTCADLDQDGDGKVSREEFAAHHEQCRAAGWQ